MLANVSAALEDCLRALHHSHKSASCRFEVINHSSDLCYGSRLTGVVCAYFIVMGVVFYIASQAEQINRITSSAIPTASPMQPPKKSTEESPLSHKNASFADLAHKEPLLQAELKKWNQLQEFAQKPTEKDYQSLPISSRYLVAARYTYPVTWGWSFSSKYTLMEKLEQDFQSKIDAPRFVQAARGAADLQERIVFAKILLHQLQEKENIEPLARLKPVIFNELKRHSREEAEQEAELQSMKAAKYQVAQRSDMKCDVLGTHFGDDKIKKIIEGKINLWASAIP